MKKYILKPKVVRGGTAIPLGNNFYYMRGRKHEQGGIDLGADDKNGLEVEGGEVVHTSKNSIKVFSAVPMLNGKSPAEKVINGENANKVFKEQEEFKDRNNYNDDGSKKYQNGGKKLLFTSLKTTNDREYEVNNLNYIYNKLKSSGLYNNKQIATILANIVEESGANPYAVRTDKETGKQYKDTGLLQWVDRYPGIDKKRLAIEELDNQINYINKTLRDTTDTVSWTHGGEGSGYMKAVDAYNEFANSNDLILKKYGFKNKKVNSIFNKRKGKRNFNLFLEDYTINPYMGCSFDCVYCYINGSKYAKKTNSYYVKSNACDLVYNKLKKLARNHERAFLNFGSASDPYMEIEKELELTREILKIFLRFKYPVHIITKSDLILRDTDILKKINDAAILPDDLKGLKSKVCVTFSFSTVDDDLASLVEPNAPLPSQRLKAMNTLAKKGFHVGVALMPILPYINDDLESLENFIKVFRKNNAAYLIPGALSLFGSSEISSRIKYYNFVKSNFPEILDDVKTLFYNREYPSNKYQNNLYRKVVRICKKQGIKTAMI